MIRELDLAGLSEFAGGTVDAAFRHHIKRAIVDCEDRPGEKKPRTITLAVRITPVILQDGAATDVKADCEVTSNVPKHVSRTVECRIKQGGRAIFNDMAEDNVEQRTIDELDG